MISKQAISNLRPRRSSTLLVPVLLALMPSMGQGSPDSQASSGAAASSPTPSQYEYIVLGQGAVGKNTYTIQGAFSIPNADTLLKTVGGYTQVISKYTASGESLDTSDIVKSSTQLGGFISKTYGLNVSPEVLQMKIALDAMIKSNDGDQALSYMSQIQSHLSFEQKSEILREFGGYLGGRWGYPTDSSGKKIDLTFTEVLQSAKKPGQTVGVCTAIHVAVAQLGKSLGLNCHIEAGPTPGSGHAVSVCQDPNDPTKSQRINYGYLSSTQSLDPAGHHQQNDQSHFVGTQVSSYNSDGKFQALLPNTTGVALETLSGGSATNMDPLGRDFTDTALALVKHGSVATGAGFAKTAEGNTIIGWTLQMDSQSEREKGHMGVVLYRETLSPGLYSQGETYAGYISGKETIYSKPITQKLRGGTFTLQSVLEVNVQVNLGVTKIAGYKSGKVADRYFAAGVGERANYTSNNGQTSVTAESLVVGTVAPHDVRDDLTALDQLNPQLHYIVSSLTASQLLAKSLTGFSKTTEVHRVGGLGDQIREEIGFDLGRVGAQFGYEGQLKGPQRADISGSVRKFFVETQVHTGQDRFRLRTGVYCRTDLSACAARGAGTLQLPLRGKGLLPSFN